MMFYQSWVLSFHLSQVDSHQLTFVIFEGLDYSLASLATLYFGMGDYYLNDLIFLGYEREVKSGRDLEFHSMETLEMTLSGLLTSNW
ncbi:hypothetical protein RchiOBHm_Chr2g0131541 [Rosa chinensis]|uniref:Uncharacterized protein n=1 Tax=Rosa chinensis TaxID=74649 RepID=A0A2P6RV36_ROSCH|nr:hypothetical protein RchiOBHm_Chr2g0131541 [Rosa chinensis]